MTELLRLRVFANLFLLLSFCILVSSAFGVEGNEAWTAIDTADSAVASAYQAVLEAEEAGANVSGLLKELNFGAEALAKANTLYRIENFDEAVYFADLGYDSIVEVMAEADGLRNLAVAERKQRLLLTSLASAFEVGFVVLCGFFGWRQFKKRYFRGVLKMKPEVVSNES